MNNFEPFCYQTKIKINLVKKYKIIEKQDGLKGYLKNLIKPQYKEFTAVNNINFNINEGELVGYIGENGAGKSTTIKMLTGLLTPTSGQVVVNGIVPNEKRIENNKNIGAVFGQKTQLWWDLPVIESFRLIKKMYKIPENEYRKNLKQFTELLQLEDLLEKQVKNLSLGQKMRCEIAATFLHNPKIVYLDEPTIGLDVLVKENIRKFIKDINKEKRTSSYGDINSYYVDAVIENVVSDLKQKLGYTETQAYNAIYREGLKIYTCQDQSLQKICDDVINNDKYYQKNTKSYLSYQLKVKKSDGETELYTEGDVRAFINDAHKKRISFYFKNRKKAEKYIKLFKKKNLDKHDKILSESINLIKQPQASFVLMEQSTGKVRAIVGGRGEKTANRTLNRASSSKRQPGSTFKVLSTYLPALDTSGFTLANVMDDAPYKYPGTNKRVKDWDSSGYKGLTSLRQGIVDSVNIVTVKTFQKVTPQTGFDYLLNLGFTTLVDRRETSDGQIYSDIQLPTALGGLTDGVTNVELTAAYAAIANGGTYIKPVYYTKIVDSKGNVLLQNSKSGKKVMKNTTAWLLTDAMKDVIKRGTGKKAAFKKIKMPQAGKTGTTSDNTDFWFEGYTPYYTAGIWLGYDSMFTQMSGSASKIMWRDIMEKVHKVKKLKNKNFKKPEDIITRKICKKCGKLAVYGLCDRALDGNDIKTEYFARGTQPKESCDCHVKYTFSNSTGHMAETGASASTNDKVYLNKDESTYKAQTKDTPYLIPGWLK